MSLAQSLQATGQFLSAAEVREFEPNAGDSAAATSASGAIPVSAASKSNLDPAIAVQLCGQTKPKVMSYGWETGRAAGGMLGIPWYVLQAPSATLLVAGSAGSGTLEVWHIDSVSDELRQVTLEPGTTFAASQRPRTLQRATDYPDACGKVVSRYSFKT